MSEDNAQIGDPQETMTPDERVDYRATVVSEWKGSESYRVIRGLIVGRLIQQNDLLLDRNRTKDVDLIAVCEGIRILNEVLELFDKPELDKAQKDEWLAVDKKAADEADMRQNQFVEEVPLRYTGM